MTLLVPLGLLGLLGIVALIIIYIIRPNYQQKFISTTFVWKLSLKYRKKKIPVSKLRNFLLILCQILILTACAVILAQPNKILKAQVEETEIIAIIDSSASMRATSGNQTRFERAVEKVQKLAKDTFDEQGIVSVIVADEAPSYLQQRATKDAADAVDERLYELLDGDTACSYATSDIDAAVSLCEEVLVENPNAIVYLYTDTQYAYVPKAIHLVDVSESDEWNASILNAKAEFEENYYAFIVEIASFGRDTTLDLEVQVYGANAADSTEEGDSVTLTTPVDCTGDEVVEVIFVNADLYGANPDRFDATYDVVCTIEGQDRVYSYHSIHVSVSEEDSFKQDNDFDIYGGLKEVIKVQYASEAPNSFWPAALTELKNVYAGHWDLQVTEIKKGAEPALEDFDVYIFEHTMPEQLPTDGIVFLVNPDKVPSKYGIRIGNSYAASGDVSLEEGEPHPIGNHIRADKITVTKFTQLILDSSYTTVLGVGQYPLFAVRNDEDMKVVVMPFSLHYSNLAVTVEFPLLVYNTFEYFYPETVKANSFEVNEKVELNARGTELLVEGYDFEKTFDVFPSYITVSTPGTYMMTQTTFTGEEVVERIYVRVPEAECNIKATGEAIAEPYKTNDKSDFLKDLLLYIAAALVALLFVEWWLKGRDSM